MKKLLLGWLAISALCLGGWCGERLASAACLFQCSYFPGWTDKTSANDPSSTHFWYMLSDTGNSCFFSGYADTGMANVVNFMPFTRKYRKVYASSTCTEKCYANGNIAVGKIECSSYTFYDPVMDITCYPGCTM